MYIDLIVLIILLVIVIMFFKRFSSFVFFMAIVEIFLRILEFIKNVFISDLKFTQTLNSFEKIPGYMD